MRKFTFVLILLCTLLCASCAQRATPALEVPTLPPNPFSEPSPQATPDLYQATEAQNPAEAPAESPHGIGFSIEPLNWDWRNENLVYDGSPIKLDFKLTGSGNGKISLGLVLFVNSFLQPHRLEQSSGIESLSTEDQSISLYSLNNDESIRIQIEFTPVSGLTGEELPFNLMSLMDPQARPWSKTAVVVSIRPEIPPAMGALPSTGMPPARPSLPWLRLKSVYCVTLSPPIPTSLPGRKAICNSYSVPATRKTPACFRPIKTVVCVWSCGVGWKATIASVSSSTTHRSKSMASRPLPSIHSMTNSSATALRFLQMSVAPSTFSTFASFPPHSISNPR